MIFHDYRYFFFLSSKSLVSTPRQYFVIPNGLCEKYIIPYGLRDRHGLWPYSTEGFINSLRDFVTNTYT